MAISETKMQMVIANYFKDECDVNTSIRQAFEKGFRIGVKKGASTNGPQEWIPCSERHPKDGRYYVTRIDYVTNTIFTDILWYEKGIWWNRQYTGDFAVIAWMPLPKPYEEVKENE